MSPAYKDAINGLKHKEVILTQFIDLAKKKALLYLTIQKIAPFAIIKAILKTITTCYIKEQGFIQKK